MSRGLYLLGSRGTSVADIVNTIAITAIQAQRVGAGG
jgi:phosphotransacetylase